jgi:hypothetical protein
MMHISIAETERFPAQAAQYFDQQFTQVHTRLSAYLKITHLFILLHSWEGSGRQD